MLKRINQLEDSRQEFVSNVSHELKTPMTSMKVLAESLIGQQGVPEELYQEFLTDIVNELDRENAIISDLLTLVKLDSTGFRLHKKEMDLHAVLLFIAAAAYTDIEDAGMVFEADIPEEPLLVEADEPQLTRVIENLLKNAVRHNPQGTKIALLVQRIPLGEEIIVADSGVAIAKSEEELFAPFVRGDSARSGDKGSGLGLSIAKKVADMHGYSLHLRQPFRGGAGHEDISFTKAFVLQVGIN